MSELSEVDGVTVAGVGASVSGGTVLSGTVLSATGAARATAAAVPEPAPESLFALRFPSDPQVSPGGKRVAFVMTRIAEAGQKEAGRQPVEDADFARPRYHSRIQLSDGGPAHEIGRAHV